MQKHVQKKVYCPRKNLYLPHVWYSSTALLSSKLDSCVRQRRVYPTLVSVLNSFFLVFSQNCHLRTAVVCLSLGRYRGYSFKKLFCKLWQRPFLFEFAWSKERTKLIGTFSCLVFDLHPIHALPVVGLPCDHRVSVRV